ncbi:MAG: heterodisulfide reductase-related iron-sulfur binding cluster, partial [Hyphomicrobiaceae bacterium]
TGSRSTPKKMTRSLLARIVPYPGRFRLAMLAGFLAKPFAGLFAKSGFSELGAMVRLAQFPRTKSLKLKKPEPGDTTIRGRVLFLAGCAQPVLRPETNLATVRMLERFGYEVVVPSGAGCCGALTVHMGREAAGKAQARRNIEAWTRAMQDAPVDAIIINASGCGTTVKDYGHLFARDDDTIRSQAERVAGLAKDITEFLAGIDLGAPQRWTALNVAYHSACSMQHGQKITKQPRDLLRKAGYAVSEIPEGHICCGSAGTYNMLQPELAGKLRDRKVANIRSVTPDLVATGNIGCLTQLQSGMDIPVVHTVELLDWSWGGPCPRGLEAFRDRVTEVPDEAVAIRDYAA